MPVDFRPTEGHIVSQAFDEAQSFKANELGTVAQFRDVGDTDYGSAFFKYVKFDTGSAPVAPLVGYVAYYYLITGYKKSEVTMDFTDAVPPLGAGVLHSVPTNGQYIWIQVSGIATLLVAPKAGVDGNALTAVGATVVDGSLDVSAAVTDQICAVATDISLKEIICMFPL